MDVVAYSVTTGGTLLQHTTRRALGLLSAVLLMFFSVSCVRDNRSDDAERPNIILIVTDDQNAQTIAFMPNLQRLLVEGGTSFSHAFSPTPLCCPGRASIMRGQYAHNHGVKSNDGVTGGFPKFFDAGNEASTLATWLQGAGYRTALVGKYFNAYPHGLVPPEGYRSPSERYVPPGWDEWYGLLDIPKDPRTNPYDMYGYPMTHNGRIVRYGDDPDDYLTDVLGGLAVDFVDDAARADDPFFLYFAPTAPHLPAIPAPRHRGVFDGLEVARSPSLKEPDMSDKPGWLRGKSGLAARTVRRLDRTYRRQAEMLLSLDEAIAALVETLRERGELASTYLVFTSDHGLHYGEHRLLRTKLTPYTASARVPLVVRGPDVPKNKMVDALTLLSDIAPTLTNVAGVPAPAFVDGRSLSPWLRHNTSRARARKQVLLEFWPREGFPVDEREEPEHIEVRVPEYRALRSERYLYTEYRYANGTKERELYDLAQDPFELHNVAGTAQASLLRSLSDKLDELQRCRASSCRKAENSALVGG
jgi:N-acetylglucosamine-6-sulfatase